MNKIDRFHIASDLVGFINEELTDAVAGDANRSVSKILSRSPLGLNGAALVLADYIGARYGVSQKDLLSEGRNNMGAMSLLDAANMIYDRARKVA